MKESQSNGIPFAVQSVKKVPVVQRAKTLSYHLHSLLSCNCSRHRVVTYQWFALVSADLLQILLINLTQSPLCLQLNWNLLDFLNVCRRWGPMVFFLEQFKCSQSHKQILHIAEPVDRRANSVWVFEFFKVWCHENNFEGIDVVDVLAQKVLINDIIGPPGMNDISQLF